MSQHALGATWRALTARLFVFCLALAPITQGSLLVAQGSGRLERDSTPKIVAPERGVATLIDGKTRKLTVARPRGSDRAAVTVRQNLLQPQEYFAFRAGHNRLVQGTAPLPVLTVRGPPTKLLESDSRLGRLVPRRTWVVVQRSFYEELKGFVTWPYLVRW